MSICRITSASCTRDRDIRMGNRRRFHEILGRKGSGYDKLRAHYCIQHSVSNRCIKAQSCLNSQGGHEIYPSTPSKAVMLFGCSWHPPEHDSKPSRRRLPGMPACFGSAHCTASVELLPALAPAMPRTVVCFQKHSAGVMQASKRTGRKPSSHNPDRTVRLLQELQEK